MEFLQLPDGHAEADLHRGLFAKLKLFLLELGRDFCFIGSEYPSQVGGRDFALDVLFFNRALNCLVAFDLKVKRFEPEHLGKMDFYLEALDRDVRKPHERPSIGVHLCATKDDEVVEYALSRSPFARAHCRISDLLAGQTAPPAQTARVLPNLPANRQNATAKTTPATPAVKTYDTKAALGRAGVGSHFLNFPVCDEAHYFLKKELLLPTAKWWGKRHLFPRAASGLFLSRAREVEYVGAGHTSVNPKQALRRWTSARRRAVPTLPRRW